MASHTMFKEENNDKSIVLCQLLEMFDSIIDKSIIETVAQSCDYTIQECIDTLISCVENAEVRNIYANKPANQPQGPVNSTTNTTQTFSQVTKDQVSPQDPDVEMRTPSPRNFDSNAFWYTGCENLYNNAVKCAKPEPNRSATYSSTLANSRTPNEDPVRDCEMPSSSRFSSPQGAIAKPENPSVIEDQIRRGLKVLIILRGLPGSGKSYFARSLISRTLGPCNQNEFIFSTDDTFLDAWGNYTFDGFKLEEAHRNNQDRVLRAARKGVSPIIVDNTNTQLWEMAPYVYTSLEHGYFLHVVESTTPWAWNINECAKRNVHSIPKSKIQRMADRFEHGLSAEQCMRKLNLNHNPCKVPPQMRSYPPLEVREEPKPQRDVKPKPQRIRRNLNMNRVLDSEVNSNENLIDLDFTDGEKKRLDENPTSDKDAGCQDFTLLMDGKEIQSKDQKVDQEKEMIDLVSRMKSFLNEKTDAMYSLINSEATLPAEDKDSSDDESSNNNEEVVSKDQVAESARFAEIRKIAMMKNVQNEEKPKIVDNINSISWSESPFPVGDLMIPKKEVSRIVETFESSTNTCAEDFGVTDEEGGRFRILKATGRDINDGFLIRMEEKPQKTLMLHKGSMTEEVFSYDEFLMRNEEEKKKCLENLVEMFPDIPREQVFIVYANACNYDFNWATEILLDGTTLDALKYKMDDPKKFDFISVNSQETKKSRPSSATKSSSKKRGDQDEETLALQKYLEEKVQLKEASYHPHILRVKRWKQREQDMEVAEIEQRSQMENAIEFKEMKPATDSESSGTSESNEIEADNDDSDQGSISSKSSSSNSLSEEMVEVKVGKEFVENLEKQFGNSEFAFPDGIFPVIQMKKSQAQELYALWLESMQQQQKVHKALIDECIETDEEYARLIERQDEEGDEADSESKLIVEEVNKSYNLDLFSHLSKAEKKTYADKVRQEGWKEYKLSRESLSKAQEAYSNCNETAGRLHSEVAKHHEKKSAYLYMVASGMFVTLSREQHNDETLDLHYLLVKEAVEAVDIFLSYHIDKLKTRPESHVTIFIITGRGLNNTSGKSRIKPAVCKLLRTKKIKFSEANAGCLKITLRKKNLIYLDP